MEFKKLSKSGFCWILFLLFYYCRTAFSWSFVYYAQSLTWTNVKTFCESQGMTAAVVNTEERWNLVVANITSNGRYYAPNDVYIGLEYTNPSNIHKWSNGFTADWTLWYANEPYDSDTRRCVRLAADVDLHFRTTDCTYSHYFACSKEDVTTTAITTTESIGGDAAPNPEMILGLSVGFTIFVLLLAGICLMCYCCTSSNKDNQNILPRNPRRKSRSSRTGRINSGFSFSSASESNFVNIGPMLDKMYDNETPDYDVDSLNDASTSSTEKTKQRNLMGYI